mgnify:CR=1 FL=1
MIVYDNTGVEINLEEIRSQVIDISGDNKLRLNIIDRIAIITFEGYSVDTINSGDLIIVELPKEYWCKNPVYSALFTSSKVPSPIMAWVSRESVKMYSLSQHMEVIGSIVYEIA